MAKILQEFAIPKESANDDGATVVKIYKKDLSEVSSGDALIDIETTKATLTIEAECKGYVRYFCKEGEELTLGAILGRIYDSPEKDEILNNCYKTGKEQRKEVKFSNAAREIILKNNINPEVFGKSDLVTVDDVGMYLGLKKNDQLENLKFQGLGIDFKKISRAKRNEIKALKQVYGTGLPSTITMEINVSNYEKITGKFPGVLQGSLLPLAVYETAKLLKRYREFNAFYLDEQIGYYKEINIGVAIDLGEGLVVAKVIDADTKEISNISTDLLELINSYGSGKLSINDVAGATFTITDLSTINVGIFTPLINKGQAAILGISGIDKKGRCTLCLTFDHCVVNGRNAGLFLGELKNSLESYFDDNSKFENKNVKCCKCLATFEEKKYDDDVVFIRIINNKGQEEYICRICLLMN